MRLTVRSPHTPQECAERLRAAIAEPGLRQIAEHEGEWPVYGRASSQQLYLGAIERRFGVKGRSRLSALGHLQGEVSALAGGRGSSIQIVSERMKRYRWVAILMFVALLPLFFSAIFRGMTAWGEGDVRSLLVYGLFIVLDLLVLAIFLSPWGFGRVKKEDQMLLDCLLALCEGEVIAPGNGEEGDPASDLEPDFDPEPEPEPDPRWARGASEAAARNGRASREDEG